MLFIPKENKNTIFVIEFKKQELMLSNVISEKRNLKREKVLRFTYD
jgi:hypothetical protein